MAKTTPVAFQQAVAAHRERLHKVLSNQTASRLKKLYDAAANATESKLRKLVRDGRGDVFTAHQQRIVLTQVRNGQMEVGRQLSKAMAPALRKAQEQSLKGLAEDVGRLHKKFTGAEITLPIEEASRFAGVIDARKTSLLVMNQSSMARYGASLIEKVEGKLATSLMSGDFPDQAIDTVMQTIGNEWWQAERIVRTEMSWADNATLADGIADMGAEFPDLMQRWEENCGLDGRPLDDRVAVDSIAMHGQVAPPGGLFTMPATAPFPDADGRTDVHKSLVGKSWEFPPNRPNDRSVLSPFMRRWGVPGWRYVNGKRVPL